MFRAGIATAILLTALSPTRAAPKPVPPSPYLPHIYRYADARLKHGRDTFGQQKTGLFLSSLDRKSLAPLTDRPAMPSGLNESLRAGPPDGPLVGANPQHDQNFLRLLYTLSELSFKPTYRDAADAELKWFLENSSGAKMAAWDEYRAWNVMTDMPIAPSKAAREHVRVWMLWDRCFELSPEKSNRLISREVPAFPLRRAGCAIRALAVAYQHTKDDQILKALDVSFTRLMEQSVRRNALYPPYSSLTLAIDCGGAALRVPEPLSSRLRAFAAWEDHWFCSVPPDFAGRKIPDEKLSSRWERVATEAMKCVSRYENTGNVKFRQLILDAADVYRAAPPQDADLWPMVFGHAICLELAAWRATARQEYLDAAIKLADFSVKEFWTDSPLPRASLKTQHFESITGADTLALALVELHLHILHITAVRAPPNTIDR